MLFSIFEILDVVIMTLVIGYLFHDVFRKPVQADDDIVDHYRQKRPNALGIDWRDFWWAAALIAPVILLHELGHKFTAMGFGLDATFHAACSASDVAAGSFLNLFCGLTIIAVVMKAIGFGFLFFVPAFVSVGSGGSHLQYSLIAFMGPLVHLVFWLVAAYLLKDRKRMRRLSERKKLYLFFFKQINMFLFILNMIPIPGFDGFNVLYHLFKAFF